MMTNLLNGAHVANKLFSTIARLRLLLVMFVALTVSAEMWAEEVTLKTKDISGLGTTEWTYNDIGKVIRGEDGSTWTFDGTYHGNNAAYLQLGQKSGKIHIPTVNGSITQITINAKGSDSGRYLQIEDSEGNHVGDSQLAENTQQEITFDIEGEYGQLNIVNHNANGSYSNSNNAIYIYSIIITYTPTAGGGGGSGDCGWIETDISNISSTDDVVITMTNGTTTWALANNNGTNSAPTALPVIVNGNTITDDIEDTYKWNISNSSGNLTIYPNGTKSNSLYCIATNNGVRVGTNSNNVFTIVNGIGDDETNDFLFNTATSRYVGVYTTNPDWRCYTLTDKGAFPNNLRGQTLKFYKYVECSTEPSRCVTPKCGDDSGGTWLVVIEW